jgi:chromosome segregation ATPase
MYLWTQADFNSLMHQLATLQASLNGLFAQVAAIKMTQATNLSNVQTSLTQLHQMENHQMSALDDLQAQVQANTDLEHSAVQAIQGIAKQLQDALNNDDEAALEQLAQQLNASAASLGSAITANTPAAGGGGDQPQVNPLQSQSQQRR